MSIEKLLEKFQEPANIKYRDTSCPSPRHFTEEEISDFESRCTPMTVPGPNGPHPQWVKNKITKGVLASWALDIDRKDKLIEWNKTVHAKKMKEMWSQEDHPWKDRISTGRPKGAKDLKPRKQREKRKVIHGDKVYADAFEAAEIYGIHPVNIRRKCRLEIEGFKYA